MTLGMAGVRERAVIHVVFPCNYPKKTGGRYYKAHNVCYPDFNPLLQLM